MLVKGATGIVMMNCVIIYEEIIKYIKYIFMKNFKH